MEDDNSTKPRRRGAQPGNANAFKHGFYSRWFRENELVDLQTDAAPGVLDEIDMVKVLMRRVFELATSEDPDLEMLIKALTALGREAFHLCGLIRLQKAIEGQRDEVAEAISAAFNEVIKELAK